MLKMKKLMYDNQVVGIRFEEEKEGHEQIYDIGIAVANSIGIVPKEIDAQETMFLKDGIGITQREIDNPNIPMIELEDFREAAKVYLAYTATNVTYSVYKNSNITKAQVAEILLKGYVGLIHTLLHDKTKIPGVVLHLGEEKIVLTMNELFSIFNLSRVNKSGVPKYKGDFSEDILVCADLYTKNEVNGFLIEVNGVKNIVQKLDKFESQKVKVSDVTVIIIR